MTDRRLIDANDAVRLLRGKCVAKYPSTFLMGLLAAASEIEQAPTVDAVPLVHCRDCRFWRDGVEGCTDHVKCCAIGFYMIEENGYCSLGKRREGE